MRIFPFSCIWLLAFSCGAHAEVTSGIKAGDTVPGCAVSDPDSGHIFKPGCKETTRRAGRITEMEYNAQGLRDKDYPPYPKAGWKRILFLGASQVVGPGLKEPDTIARKFEKYLGGAKKKVEVINGGVEGYSTLLTASRLNSWLEAYHPTHVILTLDPQGLDLMFSPYVEKEDDRIFVRMKIFDWLRPFASLRGIDLSQFEGVRRVITWQSAGYRMLHTLRCKFTGVTKERVSSCMLKNTFKALLAVRESVNKTGAKLLILAQPGPVSNDLVLSPAFDREAFLAFDKYTPKMVLPSKLALDWLKSKQFKFSVMIPISGEDLLLPNDYHYNEQGADLFARSAMLRAQPFLEGNLYR